ncbi:MAG TPA: glycosyltransferase family 4 protein [Candidatus Saccharimonadales bacterium]|nr:glycosyltransferase family 4 protein [Candidatus Saccharimonadales bacterium]
MDAKLMRIFLLSTSYPKDATDWRGVFIRHLVDGLTRSGDLHLTVWAPPGELPPAAAFAATPSESAWLAKLMAAGGISHLIRQGGAKALLTPITLLRMIGSAYRRSPDVDLYHVNWLQCALPLPSDGKPVLITALGNDLKLLKLPFVRALLRKALRNRRVAICPNADWMQETLQKVFGDVAEIIPVSFGIDKHWYDIERRLEPGRPKRWLAVTRLTADKLGPLFQWSEGLFCNNERELHLFGPMQEDIEVPDWVRYHGAASPHQLATEWFPTACGLITLSKHAEGRPQVMLEAMAAGLPIIASDMPAHATIVESGHTGQLCDSIESYLQAVTRLEDDELNHRLGKMTRLKAATEFGTWDDCAQRYIRIYRTLLKATVYE